MPKYITMREFRDDGYLQEVNRQFLHPLGLALEVDPDTDIITGVWDYRDHPEGVVYLPLDDAESHRKHDTVHTAQLCRVAARVAALGFWVQPMGVNAPPTRGGNMTEEET